jgi:hypothetical protein
MKNEKARDQNEYIDKKEEKKVSQSATILNCKERDRN